MSVASVLNTYVSCASVLNTYVLCSSLHFCSNQPCRSIRMLWPLLLKTRWSSQRSVQLHEGLSPQFPGPNLPLCQLPATSYCNTQLPITYCNSTQCRLHSWCSYCVMWLLFLLFSIFMSPSWVTLLGWCRTWWSDNAKSWTHAWGRWVVMGVFHY